MTTEIFDITVNVDLNDSIVSAPSLKIPLFFDPELTGTITNLTQGYTSFTTLDADFDDTTKLNALADAHYKQPGHNNLTKVGRTSVGDANITASLNAIWAQDKKFTALLTTTKDEVELDEIADWCANKNIFFGTSLEPDANKLDSNSSTDIASVLRGLGYNNDYIHCHHEAGVDEAAASITTASEVATVTVVAHGLRVGDTVVVSGAADAPLNGKYTIATVPTADTFTYTASGAADGADANNGSIAYFARYKFIESSFQGLQLAKDIGTTSWAAKQMTGQSAVPLTILNADEIQVLRDKGYITYSAVTDKISATNDGFMVSGRQIADETVRIWLEENMAVDILNVKLLNEKIPYTDKGFELIRTAIKTSLETQLDRTGLNPLSNTVDYTIDIPPALDQSAADRQAGIMPTIEVVARIGSVVLKITVNVTLIV